MWRKKARIAVVAGGLTIAALLIPGSATADPKPYESTSGSASQASPSNTAPSPAGIQASVPQPEKSLGEGWQGSSDVVVTGRGDASGFHLYIAREDNAFAWSTLATLTSSAVDTNQWAGNVCVTGSGRYAVAVYAPAAASNKPELLLAGGFAAVVDIQTGKATRVATGVQLAYFNPACGPTDRVLLTRGIGAEGSQTDVLTVDAAKSAVTSTRRVTSQLTTPVPAKDGDYGIVRGALAKLDGSGRTTAAAKIDGQAFELRATGAGAIDILSIRGERTVAQRYAAGKMARIGDAPQGRLQLFGQANGENALVGEVSSLKATGLPGLSTIPNDRTVQALSQRGHLMALEMTTEQTAKRAEGAGLATPRAEDAGRIRVTVRATRSGKTATGTVTGTTAPILDTVPAAEATSAETLAVSTLAPKCAIPRNNPRIQAPQPSPNQVEWAIDQAVHGQLTAARPNNYLNTDMPSYSPQGMFGTPKMTVPAQVMLGIVAQESNMAQASWHAVPGDAANPLIGNYYGNNLQSGLNIDLIDYEKADCGYGITQVTDGMEISDTETDYIYSKQVAIATDYAANIAAGLQILIQKWDQLHAIGTFANNDDSRYIENWYFAIWCYNTGVHPVGEDPRSYGAGWLNNPANPIYSANRAPYLRDSYGDADHPWQWPYQEKVMGWIEYPQLKGNDMAHGYSRPTFGKSKSGKLELPADTEGKYLFCNKSNNCSSTTSGCPAEDASCWFHGSVNWADCSKACAVENAPMLGQPEPPVQRIYPTACDPFGTSSAVVVDDLNNSSLNVLGCAGQARGGKFTIRLGNRPGLPDRAQYAEIDLHQLGAGYLGHMLFTHTYDPATMSNTQTGMNMAQLHKVVGSWTPELTTAGNHDILVHIPSHGADATAAEYIVYGDKSDGLVTSCTINQGANQGDSWVYLGMYNLNPGARVQLTNLVDGANGSTDIAFDAMAFLPTSGSGHGCGQVSNW